MSIELPRLLEALQLRHVPFVPQPKPASAVAPLLPVADAFIDGGAYLPEAAREEVYGGPPPEGWGPSGTGAEPVGGGAPLVRRGSRGSQVRSLQQKLEHAGYNPGPADGVFGPRTEAAVRRYQKKHHLSVDGVVGPQTWNKLGVKHSSGGKVGVKTLQRELKQAGVNPGPVDGQFGRKTEAAVKRFQKRHHLAVDGVVGPKTWHALGVKSSRILRRHQSHSAGGTVHTPDGTMTHRQGHLISSRIAGKFDRMVAAARRDGVSLRINNAYRSYAEQVVLWNRYGRNPARVAPPGHSNHQTGTAIDFVGTPGAYSWLKRNASRYGLHNYPPEPWHYSLNGR